MTLDLGHLAEIDCSWNDFKADIVTSLYMTYAKRLLLSHNQLYGSLPPDSGFISGYVSTARCSCCCRKRCLANAQHMWCLMQELAVDHNPDIVGVFPSYTAPRVQASLPTSKCTPRLCHSGDRLDSDLIAAAVAHSQQIGSQQ